MSLIISITNYFNISDPVAEGLIGYRGFYSQWHKFQMPNICQLEIIIYQEPSAQWDFGPEDDQHLLKQLGVHQITGSDAR